MSETPRRALVKVVEGDIGSGIYANLLGVWHTQDDFTLDFAVLGMGTQEEDGTLVAEAPIVARIKVPVTVIFRIAQAIATNVDKYEHTFGPITPRPPPNDDQPPIVERG